MRGFLILFFILAQTSLFAFSYEDVKFSYLTKEKGLSDNNVECIFKDSDGFVWFGTRNGLCRFDGYEIKVYRKGKDKTGLSGNRILSITEDTLGNLWVGTYKDGLNKFDKQTEIFTHYGNAKGIGERVDCIKVLSDGNIWVGSNRGVGVINSSTDSIQTYSYPQGLNGGLVYDILETSNNDIYIATEGVEIQKYDRAEDRFVNIPYKRLSELSSNYRKQLVEGNDGLIWIAASYHGLCSYNPESGASEIYTAENGHLSTNVLMGDMDIDMYGNLWICTEEDGINIFNTNTKKYTHFRHNHDVPSSLNSNHIYTVFFDSEHIAWIGTFNKGVNIFNPYQEKFNSTLFSFNDLLNLKGLSILDVFEDSKNRVWIGTDGDGLFCFEKGENTLHFVRGDKHKLLTSNVITSLGEDPYGNILIGTYSGGMIRFNPESNKIQKFYSGTSKININSPHVWEILTDSKSRVWLGLLAAGVERFYYNNGTFKNFGPYSNEKNKIDFQNVMVIMEDSDGDLWFGTEGRGIYIWDNETDRILRIKDDGNSNVATQGVITCLFQDQWSSIWIGTEDDGLYKYSKAKGTFERYSAENGFVSDRVQSINEDPSGNLWIGTASGLFMMDHELGLFNKFITEDGLSSNDFNADAMIRLADGRILAGTHGGVDIISNNLIKLNEELPRLVFTKLTILGNEVKPGSIINERKILEKSISYTNEVEILWKDKIFTLEFAALNYTLPEKCQYKYKLDGFDKNWIYTNADRRFATYSNLDAGKYTFRVIASNNDGKWGENELTLDIIIKPPFWETSLFRVFVILVFIGVVYLLYRRRIETQKEIFKQKQLEQERKIIALENEKLESELKKLAFNILSKNKLLIDQKQKLQNLSNKAKLGVKEGIEKIVQSIDDDMDENKDWKFIEPQIDKAYNQFITKLRQKHPDLSATEIRIAAYIRMNLSTKEICEFMNKTQRAIENDRYRLRKKIGLETNDSIQQYFLDI